MNDQVLLKCTDDYSLFIGHELNRPMVEKPRLEASMKKHGFLPSCPIHCIPTDNGKLKVVRGHHRLYYAKKLNISVYYIVDTKNVDIYDLEGDSTCRWSIYDFAYSRAMNGCEHCKFLLKYQQMNDIPFMAAASLVLGESAGSNNATKRLREGTFRVGNLAHANDVVSLLNSCTAIPSNNFYRSASFINALSLIARIPELDLGRMKEKLSKYSTSLLVKRARAEDYVKDLENVYNRSSHSKINLSMRSKEVANQRNPSKKKNVKTGK